MQITGRLAEYAATLEYKDIPVSIVEKAKEIILDTVGVGLGGAQVPSSRILCDLVSQLGGVPESTIFGNPGRTSCASAALVNGAMAHALELEEAQTLPGHPAVAVLPTALAIAEPRHSSGRELIAAFVAGYDVHCRLAQGFTSSGLGLGWHFTSICGVFGAAAAAGRLLRFDREVMANALGLAGCQAAGNLLSETDGTLAKRLQPGLAAQGGIISALLAERGFTGPTNVLEARRGFFDLYAGEYDLSPVISDLGTSFEIAKSNLKIYPCCSFVHAAVDATLALVSEHRFGPDDVSQIEVRVTRPTYTQVCQPLDEKRRPPNPVFAQFSLPFFVAMAVCRGAINLDPVDTDTLQDPAILALAQKVVPVLDPGLEAEFAQTGNLPVVVTVTDLAGQSCSRRVVFPKGSPQNPLGSDEIRSKFEHFACRVLPSDSVKQLAEGISHLEERDNVANLWQLLEGPGQSRIHVDQPVGRHYSR
jgi:2-methylcitrate dehydratase PrpD